MSDRDAEIRRLKRDYDLAHSEVSRLERDLKTLKKKCEEDGRKLEGLRGAANELLFSLDRLLVEQNGTIYEVMTAISLLRGAL